MNETYLVIRGDVVAAEDLAVSKARDVVNAVQKGPYTQLVECRRTSEETEIVVFDVEVELGQRKVNDIKRFERIAIEFYIEDNFLPEILALRSDFPKVPHLNLRASEFPRNLCVFEEQYNDLKLRWTGPFFVERIREWLALTAKGKLHADDQPLEPLLPDLGWHLILPSDMFAGGSGLEFISILDVIDSGNNQKTLIAGRAVNLEAEKGLTTYIAALVFCEPQTHGVISAVPSNILELHEFLQKGSFDLLKSLREGLSLCNTNNVNLMEARLVLIVSLPKLRNGNAHPEDLETRAFMVKGTIKEIGVDIGIWGVYDSTVGKLIPVDKTKNGQHLPIILLNPLFSFSRNLATYLSGLATEKQRRIVAVGVGAVGSQVFINLIRMGYGEWTLLDKDFLLPHNLGRHALTANSVGYPKATSLASTANAMMGTQEPVAEGVATDILKPVDPEKVKSVLENADVILDASTSIAVARHLAHYPSSSARRISLFVNPLGTDLIILAEDQQREVTLDLLEMQYYRYLINESALEDHLQQNQGSIRYANSCRDISSTIPQDLIALQSAICSRALLRIIAAAEPAISIWHTDTDHVSVQKYSASVAHPIKFKIGEWVLCTDQAFVSKIYEARAAKLPNETGGILLGSYDMERKVVYVVDTILSPPDSEEWPTVYIRGYQGLKQGLERVEKVTAGNLQYVGEWHSHPPGFGCDPSKNDQQAFCWLTDIMNADGLPPLMLIAGDQEQYGFYLNQLEPGL